ncbi:MAG: hypothetical protein JNK24_07310 [Alphaproteobacteria bacterium]|nr:hypothetical protein [Alphaproteobacteria bacterium]
MISGEADGDWLGFLQHPHFILFGYEIARNIPSVKLKNHNFENIMVYVRFYRAAKWAHIGSV